MSKQIQFKAIPTGRRNEWTVISFYIRPGMGECHTGYRDVFALTADEAIAFVAE